MDAYFSRLLLSKATMYFVWQNTRKANQRFMILVKDLQPTLDTLEGIVNSTVHPNIAVRAVMVDLKPIRKEIFRLKAVMAHIGGPSVLRDLAYKSRGW